MFERMRRNEKRQESGQQPEEGTQIADAADEEALQPGQPQEEDAQLADAAEKEPLQPGQPPEESCTAGGEAKLPAEKADASMPLPAAGQEPDGPSREPDEAGGLFKRLRRGLSKTRNQIVHGFDGVFKGHTDIDDDFYEEIEELLVMGDIGIRAAQEIIENLQEKVQEHHIQDPQACRSYLMSSIREQLTTDEAAYRFEEETSVVLVIGVNGVGKTTTIGKLAGKLHAQGKKVVLAAADTFRAAAGEQLVEWAHRAGADIIAGQEGSDPGAVVYDAVQAAKARKADVLLCDTAGRLHNKKNLMEELKKISRILAKEYPDAYQETLIVLDATTGQNALEQARQFREVCDISGIVLTKMDGTAKGGIAVAIASELGIPVKYIGVGESMDDLMKFDPDRFVEALFDCGDTQDEE